MDSDYPKWCSTVTANFIKILTTEQKEGHISRHFQVQWSKPGRQVMEKRDIVGWRIQILSDVFCYFWIAGVYWSVRLLHPIMLQVIVTGCQLRHRRGQ